MRVDSRELLSFLKNIPTERVCGFGPNTVALLKKHRIETVLDYISRPEVFAKNLLGKIGVELWHELRGEAVFRIITEVSPRQASLSKTKTFTPPSSSPEFVRAQALRNLESAFIRLRRHGLRTAGLGLHLTDHQFKSTGLYADLNRPTASTLEALSVFSTLFRAIFQQGKLYRRTGVLLEPLETDREFQGDLFEDPCRVKALRKISETTDAINALYGKHTLHLGSTDSVREFQQHLGERGSVASRKTDLLKGETARQRLRVPIWNLKI